MGSARSSPSSARPRGSRSAPAEPRQRRRSKGCPSASRPATTGRTEPAALATYCASSAQARSCSRPTGPSASSVVAIPTATPRMCGACAARAWNSAASDSATASPPATTAQNSSPPILPATDPGARLVALDSADATARSAASPSAWDWLRSLAALRPLTSAMTRDTGRPSRRWAESASSSRSSTKRRLPSPVRESEYASRRTRSLCSTCPRPADTKPANATPKSTSRTSNAAASPPLADEQLAPDDAVEQHRDSQTTVPTEGREQRVTFR